MTLPIVTRLNGEDEARPFHAVDTNGDDILLLILQELQALRADFNECKTDDGGGNHGLRVKDLLGL